MKVDRLTEVERFATLGHPQYGELMRILKPNGPCKPHRPNRTEAKVRFPLGFRRIHSWKCYALQHVNFPSMGN